MPRRRVRWRRLVERRSANTRRPRAGTESDSRKRASRWWDWIDFDLPDLGCLGEAGTVIMIVIAAIIAALILWFLVIPLLLALLDVVVLIALAGGGVLSRLLFRRPWEIEAVGGGQRLARAVSGGPWSAETPRRRRRSRRRSG